MSYEGTTYSDDDISAILARRGKTTPANPPLKRSRHDYEPLIQKHAAANNLDPDLLRAMMSQESGGNPRARSNKDAHGLMQLIPATASRFGVKDIYDPDENIRGGAEYTKFLLDRYKGDVPKTLAGYNAGEGAVDKYKGIPPYKETQNYVKSIGSKYKGAGYAAQASAPQVGDYAESDLDAIAAKYQQRNQPTPVGNPPLIRPRVAEPTIDPVNGYQGRGDDFAPPPPSYAAEQAKYNQFDTVSREAISTNAQGRVAANKARLQQRKIEAYNRAQPNQQVLTDAQKMNEQGLRDVQGNQPQIPGIVSNTPIAPATQISERMARRSLQQDRQKRAALQPYTDKPIEQVVREKSDYLKQATTVGEAAERGDPAAQAIVGEGRAEQAATQSEAERQARMATLTPWQKTKENAKQFILPIANIPNSIMQFAGQLPSAPAAVVNWTSEKLTGHQYLKEMADYIDNTNFAQDPTDDPLNPENNPIWQMGKSGRDRWDQVLEPNRDYAQELLPSIANGLGQVTSQIAMGMSVTKAMSATPQMTKNVAAVLYTSESGQAGYAQAREYGATPDEANVAMLLNAMITAGTEKIPMDQFIDNLTRGKNVSKGFKAWLFDFSKAAGKGGVTEYTQETTEQGGQGLANTAVYGAPLPTGAEINRAGLTGLAVGTVAGGGSATAGRIMNRPRIQPEAQVQPETPSEAPILTPQSAPVAPGQQGRINVAKTMPERPATLQAQISAMRSGTRDAVLVTEGEAMPTVPPKYTVTNTQVGKFIHDPKTVSPAEIRRAARRGDYVDLLGIVDPEAHGKTDTAVVARNGDGVEQQAAEVRPEMIEPQAAKLKEQFPDASVAIEPTEKVIAERAQGVEKDIADLFDSNAAKNSLVLRDETRDELSSVPAQDALAAIRQPQAYMKPESGLREDAPHEVINAILKGRYRDEVLREIPAGSREVNATSSYVDLRAPNGDVIRVGMRSDMNVKEGQPNVKVFGGFNGYAVQRNPNNPLPEIAQSPATKPSESPVTVQAATPKLERKDRTIERRIAQRQRTAQTLRRARDERRSETRRADTDALTGLANVAALQKALPSAEADPNTSVISFDVNNFKTVNDTVGHPEGDRALKEIAAAIKQASEESGVTRSQFRSGGDEFVALVPAEKAEAIKSRAEEIYGDRKYGDVSVSLSGSVGTTFADADSRLQKAKNARKQNRTQRTSKNRPRGRFAEGKAEPKLTPAEQKIQDKINRRAIRREYKPPSADPTKHSLHQYVALKGGINASDAFDTTMLQHEKYGIKPLVRKQGGGMDAEDMMRSAIEDGYLPEYHFMVEGEGTYDRGSSVLLPNDFIQMVTDDVGARVPQHSAHNPLLADAAEYGDVHQAELRLLERENDFQKDPDAVAVLAAIEDTGEISETQREELAIIGESYGLPKDIIEGTIDHIRSNAQARIEIENDPSASPDDAENHSRLFSQETEDSFDFGENAKRTALKSASPEIARQTESPEFKRWFGDSKVVDNNDKPLVVYHGTSEDFDVFQTSQSGRNETSSLGLWFAANPDVANNFATTETAGAEYFYTNKDGKEVVLPKGQYSAPNGEDVFFHDKSGQQVLPVFLSLQNPKVYQSTGDTDAFDLMMDARDKAADVQYYVGTTWRERGAPRGSVAETNAKYLESLKGHDGILLQGTHYDSQPLPETSYYVTNEGDNTIESGFDSYEDANKRAEEIEKTTGLDHWVRKAQKGIETTKPSDQYIVFSQSQVKSATGNIGTFDESGNILKSADAELSALRDVELDTDLVKDVESSVDGATVTISPHTAELMRRIEDRESGASFPARFLDPTQRREMVRAFRQGAAEMRASRFPLEDAAKLDKVASDLAQAGRANERRVVIQVDNAPKSAEPHEYAHEGSYAGALDKSLSGRHRLSQLKALAQSDAAEGWRELYKDTPQYENVSDALVVEETFGTIAGGEYQKLGITAEQAAEYMTDWFDSYTATNGVESLSKFRRQTNDTNRIIEKVRANQGRQAETGRPESGSVQSLPKESPPPKRPKSSSEPAVHNEEGKERLRQLPKSLRRYGIEAADMSYLVYSDKASAQDAQEIIQERGIEGAIQMLLDADTPSKKLFALHWTVDAAISNTLAKAEQDGDKSPEVDNLRKIKVDLIRKASEWGTEAGQTVQSMSMYQRSATDHMLLELSKLEDIKGRVISPERAAEAVAIARTAEAALALEEVAASEVGRLDRELKKNLSEKEKLQAKVKSLETDILRTQEQEKRLTKLERTTGEQQKKIVHLQSQLRRVKQDLGDVDRPKGVPSYRQVRDTAIKKLSENEDELMAKLSANFGRGEMSLKSAAPETDAFRRWFGKSKVVDEKGEPLAVYHGTSNPVFNKFSERGGMGGPLGYWFASTGEAASQFARDRYAGQGGAVYPVHLSIENPMQYRGWKEFTDHVEKLRKGGSIEQGVKSLRRQLATRGFDGVVIRGSDTDMGGVRDDWVAFKDSQIKSATGNRGTYDKSGNILKSATPETQVRSRLTNDDINEFAQIGALTLLRAERGTSVEGWKKTMRAFPFGKSIESSLDRIHAESRAIVKASLKDARIERTLDSIQKRVGNENLSRTELQKIADTESAERKRISLIEAEHGKAAKAYEKAQNPIMRTAEKAAGRVFGKSEDAIKSAATKAAERVLGRTVGGVQVYSKEFAEAIASLSPNDTLAVGAAKFTESGMTAEKWATEIKDQFGLTLKEQKDAYVKSGEIVKEAKKIVRDAQNERLLDRKKIKGTERERTVVLATLDMARRNSQSSRRAMANQLDNMRSRSKIAYWAGRAYREFQNSTISIKASVDASFLMRQGGRFFWQNLWTPAGIKKNLGFLAHGLGGFKQSSYVNTMHEIESHPMFAFLQRMGIEFGRAGGGLGNEFFQSELLPKIPLVKTLVGRSDTAFNAGLDYQRFTEGLALANAYLDAGMTWKDNRDAFEYAGKLINLSTGVGDTSPAKGGIGAFRTIIRNLPLFGPRFTLSRFQLANMDLNPMAWVNRPAHSQKVFAKQFAKYYGAIGVTMALLVMAGAKIMWDDPDDPDFGKVRFGDKVYDLFSGELQPVRAVIRAGMAMTRQYQLGGDFGLAFEDTIGIGTTRMGFMTQMMADKLRPDASMIMDVVRQRQRGNKQLSKKDAVIAAFAPISLSNVYKTLHEKGVNKEGLKSVALTTPADIIGIGVGQYEMKDRPHTTAEKLANRLARPTLPPDEAKTEADIEGSDKLSKLRQRSRAGENVDFELLALVNSGIATIRQADNIRDQRGLTSLEIDAPKLSLENLKRIEAVSDDANEKRILADLIELKTAREIDTAAPKSDKEDKRSPEVQKIATRGIMEAVAYVKLLRRDGKLTQAVRESLGEKAAAQQRKGTLTDSEHAALRELQIDVSRVPRSKARRERERRLSRGISIQ